MASVMRNTCLALLSFREQQQKLQQAQQYPWTSAGAAGAGSPGRSPAGVTPATGSGSPAGRSRGSAAAGAGGSVSSSSWLNSQSPRALSAERDQYAGMGNTK